MKKSPESLGEEIALWFIREVKKDGVFANLVIPVTIAFVTAIVTVAIFS